MARKTTDAPQKTGRPSAFSSGVADEICGRLIAGESLRGICEDDHLPDARTVHRWLASEDEDFATFRQQYAHARTAQAETIFDEILEIADDGRNDWMLRKGRGEADLGWAENGEALSRSRLRVDARKWMAGKLAPKKYGDKLAVEGDPDAPPIRLELTVKFV